MNADARLMTALETAESGGGMLPNVSTPLPPDLARQAVVRIRKAAWAFAATWLVVIVLNDFIFAGADAGAPGIVWGARQTTLTVLGLVSSLALVWLTRKLEAKPEVLFDIALGYQVLLALIVALLTEYYPRTEAQAISWVCVVILTLPILTPASPRKTLAAGLASATTVLLAVLHTRLVNPAYNPNLAVIVWLTLPAYICAVLAVIPALVFRNLGRQVKRARELGSYQLEEKIASGGMGDVYRARHRLLARPAAVKLISPSVLAASGPNGSQVAIERFRREAEAAASLNSPHTIQLFDYGVSDDGVFYYVMELLDGIDLHELILKHGPVPAERAIHILTQACESLAEAHAMGMVHRDIKPSNILACRIGLHCDFVKVLDFGLVKKDSGAERDEVHLTRAGAVSGTPAFMSPESISDNDSVGAPSDIYALGCVAYWLLTGQNVFTASNPTMMMMQHIQNSPVPPSHKAPHPVPSALEDLVVRCLSKRPEERPADATELLDLLGRVKVPAAWSDARAKEWWNTHRAPSAAMDFAPAPLDAEADRVHMDIA